MIILSRIALVALVLSTASHAFATPVFAKKEGKPCGYCHNNPKGAGPRTTAGEWYKSHSHTFAGFKAGAKPAAPAGKKPAAKPAPKKK